MNKKLVMIVALVLVISTISFSRSFLGLLGIIPWHYGYSDVYNEQRINEALAKKIPYIEQPIEYPVITGLFIYLMWQIGKSLLGYAIFTWIFLTAFAIITAITLYKLVNLLKINEERIFWYFIFAPSLVIFGVYNWDVIAVMFMVLSIYFFYRNNFILSSIFLSFGFNAKLFPVVLLPVIMAKTNIKQGVKLLIVFSLTTIILNSYFIINSFDVWKTTYTFHALREPNIDSIWALTHFSANTINTLSLVLFLSIYLILIFYQKKFDFISLSFASIIALLLFSKVFSPQYLLWLLPFFVLSQNITRKIFYSLEASNLIVFLFALYWIFASKGQIFLSISRAAVIARSLLLTFCVILLLKRANLSK